MSSKLTMESIQESIEKIINASIEEAILQEIETITERITKNVRSRIGTIAAACLSFYDIRMDRNQLIITVNTKDMETK